MRKAGLRGQPAGTETTLLAPEVRPKPRASWPPPPPHPLSPVPASLGPKTDNSGAPRPLCTCPPCPVSPLTSSQALTDSGLPRALSVPLPVTPLFRKPGSRRNSQRTGGLVSGPAWLRLRWALFLVEGVSLFPRGARLHCQAVSSASVPSSPPPRAGCQGPVPAPAFCPCSP